MCNFNSITVAVGIDIEIAVDVDVEIDVYIVVFEAVVVAVHVVNIVHFRAVAKSADWTNAAGIEKRNHTYPVFLVSYTVDILTYWTLLYIKHLIITTTQHPAFLSFIISQPMSCHS